MTKTVKKQDTDSEKILYFIYVYIRPVSYSLLTPGLENGGK